MPDVLSALAQFFAACGKMILTMFPVILGGILNMVVCKTPFYKKHHTPMDRGRVLSDGNRIFGDNKTWLGFVSMILCCIVTTVLWGLLLNGLHITHLSELYKFHPNRVPFNLLAGTLFGFAYMLLELPNSFLKRRLSIEPGKTDRGLKGLFFFLLDQTDSLFGVILVLALFSRISVARYFGYIALGGLIHITVNLVLYKTGIRKNL